MSYAARIRLHVLGRTSTQLLATWVGALGAHGVVVLLRLAALLGATTAIALVAIAFRRLPVTVDMGCAAASSLAWTRWLEAREGR